jgi:hypothetical protein
MRTYKETFQNDDALTTPRAPPSGGYRRRRIQISALAVVLTLAVVTAAGSSVRAEPRLADANTPFHRVYVVGDGDSAQEDQALRDDLNELRAALENGLNQSSLNSISLTGTNKWFLEWVLNSVKTNAQPGDAVTIYLSGRGNEDVIRLGSGEELSAAEFADMLDGFMEGVSRVVIADSCFGGSFVDDIGESEEVAVIGTSTTCPIDPPFDDFIQTFAEDIALHAGQRKADGVIDGVVDGVVTAAELETALTTLGWKLGEAGIGDEIENGQSKCLGTCDLPAITLDPPDCAAMVDVAGVGFAANADVNIEVLDQSLTLPVDSGTATTDAGGVFTGVNDPPGEVELVFPSLVTATDGTNQDWQFCPVGAGAPPDETAPSCELRAGTGVIEGTIQDLESGLAEIEIIRDWNVDVFIEPFTVGTTDPVSVLATISDTGRTARLGLKAIDVAGNATVCLKTVRRSSSSWSWSWRR